VRHLDPEVELTRRRLEGDFGEALRAALAQLATRERTVLRLAVVAGFSPSRIATIYRVNTSTVSRWLAKARAQVFHHPPQGGARIGTSGHRREAVAQICQVDRPVGHPGGLTVGQ
jgi:DNA-directed RNA polymerase specialized sigma24 family protein